MRAILTFHAVDGTGSVLSISRGELSSLIGAVLRSGHAIVPLEALVGAQPPRRAVSLTFDDGLRSVADEALPVLRDHGVTASLFAVTDRVGGDNAWPTQPAGIPRLPLLDWDALEALRAEGWTIESHTASHPDLRLLSDDALEDELGRASETLERRLGRRARVLAYPYGSHDVRVRRVAARHHPLALTVDMAELRRTDDPLALPRLDAYYLRRPSVHRDFGGAGMRAWLALRTAARRVRRRFTRAPG